MVRVLVVIGLLLATATYADARGFGRFSFRSHAAHGSVGTTAARTGVGSGTMVVPVPSMHLRQNTDPQPAIANTGSGAGSYTFAPAIAPATAQAAPTPKAKPPVMAANWCDKGSVVGSGQGFCVMR